MDKNFNKLLKNIELVTTHATKIMEREKDHTSSNKDVYWVIFDKDYNPYFLVSTDPEYGSEYSFYTYKINKKKHRLDENDKIAILDISVKKNESILEYLEILKESLAGKKIGSSLVDLFEYIAFTKGAKKASGTAIAFNKRMITQKKLNGFYRHKKFNVRKAKDSKHYRITKKIDSVSIKNYAKNFITIKKQNVIFKIQVPNNYKPMIAYELAKKKNRKVRFYFFRKETQNEKTTN